MKAIILAGGQATRLRPITNNLPKCLLNVGGKTIIDRQIESLFAEKIEEIILVTGFKSELLEQHIQLHHPNKNIRVIKNEQYESTGPAYGLWCARKYLGESEILYLNGDLVCDHGLIKDLIINEKNSLTAVSRNDWDEEQVKVQIDSNRSIRALGKWIEKSQSYGEFVGATKISKKLGQSLRSVLEILHKEGILASKFAADALNEAIAQTKSDVMYVYDATNYKTIEIDTIYDFKTASKMWKKRVVNRFGTLLKIISARIIHAASFIFPKSKGKAIFIGWHKNEQGEIFADNAKYLFLHTHINNKKNIRPIWIAKDKQTAKTLNTNGMESYFTYSVPGIWHALTAKLTVIDAHMYRDNWQFSGGSKIIQLWHGKGMKKSGLTQKGSLEKWSKFISPELFQRFEFFIASSDYTAKLMADTFKIPEKKVIVTGLPRNDVLYQDVPGSNINVDKEYKNAISEFRKNKTSKIIAYMPTFRRNSSNPLDQLDLSKLNNVLAESDYKMIITLHPKFSSAKYSTSSELKNIRIMSAGYDIYPLFKDIDMLITDYSSLYVDYLLLDRPVIFFTYDRESYEKETGLYGDFDDLTPGPHIKTFQKLVETITSYDDSNWKNARRDVAGKLHSFKDGNASRRVLQEIFKREDREWLLK